MNDRVTTAADGPDRGIVLAGTASGVGKTVATLAVLRALDDAGHEPVAAKAGPDFIDPSHHAAVTGTPSRTLDTWMQGIDGVRRSLARSAGDFAVIEGMMGLYDGSVTSTAATAAALSLPVVLVVDASAGMQSVGATALGFREYAAHTPLPEDVRTSFDGDPPSLDVVGVIAQRAHGGRHAEGIRESLPDGIAFLGRIPPTEGLEIPDRHLGLRMGDEAPIDPETLTDAAEAIDVAALRDVARPPARPAASSSDRVTELPHDAQPTVAVAEDAAFRFVYPAVRERLAALATVELFAPVAGDDLPDCDAVYLPGGYPELHAEALADSPALSTIADRAAEGLPILGECGGLMALSGSLTTTAGDTHEMAGVLPGAVRMRDRYQALDHVELRARRDTPAATAGETHRGHEFHYSSHALGSAGADDGGTGAGDGGQSTLDGAESAGVDAAVDPDTDARFAFDVRRGEGIDGDHDGLTVHRTVGTYAHRHADSGMIDRLVAAARGED
ncbi:cobyrinate a,c-diamide synthase [Halopenitus persicus]|uniref:Hydrogenobyrinic acid a,c-diamide synthase (Glutamine-hydrolysing) /cobyrinate a,c-diamide synthase n=1 Tax=Halopenitus persicus TaxID=1048396 RepID=A0A1H3DTQ5_9EURY|nr:cobyrinate a,c-diamide synthase [Halopenitus persicus]SDX69700.1 hydrogenobyrinic acid a,c-diamide synthase (glutamine-hydrolysing) /cobyrinate a,c-diamide synthase [Halopenitus persicus]